MATGKISEIFTSIQGEGKYLGQEQCFIRFYDCNLSCEFCDTKMKTFKEYSGEGLISKVKEIIGPKDIDSVSITGGEPLQQRNFLLEFLPKLKREGFNSYLETNGILYNELFDTLDYVDVISMDIKLPSSTKQKSFWQEHEEFLKIAKDKDIFIKAIICIGTTWEDFKTAVNLVSQINPKVTFILQPNTLELGKDLANKLLEFKKYSKEHLFDVRVIPQLHKVMGVK